jgi:hypothetical protein
LRCASRQNNYAANQDEKIPNCPGFEIRVVLDFRILFQENVPKK